LKRIPAFHERTHGQKLIRGIMKNKANASIKLNVDFILENNRPFSLALDTATTKGMKYSYLGLVIFYVDSEGSMRNFVLDLIDLHGAHTGQMLRRITEEALEKWNLSLNDAVAVITDGASNMGAAFK